MGRIGKELAVRQITDLLVELNRKLLQSESANLAYAAQKAGFETLTTDTQGRRSIEWFKTHNKPFATGVATRCLVCAIVNGQVGMAASHRNTITVADFEYSIRRSLDDRQFRQSLEDDSPLLGTMVTPESLRGLVSLTVNQTFDEFSQLAPGGIPVTGTSILFAGLNYLSMEELNPVVGIAMKVMHKRISKEGKMLGVKKEIRLNIGGLGKELGVIWGGPNHPSHSEPTFYSLRIG